MPPPLGQGIVPRSRVVRVIEQAVDAPVTLVVAPAGFGKTTAISEWVSQTTRPVAWLTLDEGDRAGGRFTSHLQASLRGALPEVDERNFAPIEDIGRSPSVIGAAIAERLHDLKHELVLVIDDLHEAAAPDVLDVVSAIIQYPPPSLRLILSARWDPQLPIARLRGRGWLAEVRAADLRFTEDETRMLLGRTTEAPPDAETVAVLQERTEGWPAGLRLASVALRSRADTMQLTASFPASSDRHVMDFLLDEVLARQSPESQAFLLRTSITDQTCGALADAIVRDGSDAGTSGRRLDAMMRANLYLEQADPGDEASADHVWYRYHRLFRDLLRHRLSLEASEDDIAACHGRASRWFVNEGMIEQAVFHAMAAGEVDTAASIVENARADALRRGQVQAVEAWLRLLPASIVSARPGLLLTRAWIAFLHGQMSAVRVMLRDVDRAMMGQTSGRGEPDDRSSLTMERNLLFALTFDIETESSERDALLASLAAGPPAVNSSWQALALFLGGLGGPVCNGADGASPEGPSWLPDKTDPVDVAAAELLMIDALAERTRGNVHEAERLAFYARRLAERHQSPQLASWASMVLGSIAYDRNELEAAERLLTGFGGRHQRHCFVIMRDGLITLAMTQQALGRHDLALDTATALLEAVLEFECFEHLSVAEALRIRLALLQHDHETPRAWLDGHRTTVSGTRAAARYVQITRVLALAAQDAPGRLEEAAAIAHGCLAELGPATPARDRLEVSALYALTQYRATQSGRSRMSTDDVIGHLRRAIEHGLTRVVADFGPIVPRFLDAAGIDGAAEPWAAILRAACGEPGPEPAPHPASPAVHVVIAPPAIRGRQPHILEVLTERESDVLACLNEHMSNQEIADRLFISPLTVKRHASNIYDKLGVNSRRQALVKAIELGFIQPR